MKTLHLTLKKKWFDMILSGEKKEEYREIKPYWIQRLSHPLYPLFRKYDVVEFRNGYSKNAPTMIVECGGISTGFGYKPWGGTGEKVYIIKLGKIIETKNV